MTIAKNAAFPDFAAALCGPLRQPRQMLAEHYLRTGEPKEALTVAQNATAALPDNMQLLDVLGRAQLANGEHNQAQSSFNRMAALQPKSPLPYLRMSSAHLVAGDQAAAAEKLRKALEITPNLLQAQQGLASLAMAANKPDEALTIARTVQKQRPKEAAGYILEGEMTLEQVSRSWAPYLTMAEGIKIAAQSFTTDVSKLSCCAV